MTATQIIAADPIVIAVGVQAYGLAVTVRQARRTYGRGALARRMTVRAGWPHAVSAGGMLLWAALLAWGGFWS